MMTTCLPRHSRIVRCAEAVDRSRLGLEDLRAMDVRFSSTESPSYSSSDVTRSSIPPFTSDGDSRDWLLDTLGEPLCRLDRLPVSLGLLIGIGGSLAAPPLPHHRAYGSVPRRFDRVRRLTRPPTEEGRSSRNRRWIGPAVPSHGDPCAIHLYPRNGGLLGVCPRI